MSIVCDNCITMDKEHHTFPLGTSIPSKCVIPSVSWVPVLAIKQPDQLRF